MRPTLTNIINGTMLMTGVRVAELVGPSRVKRVIRARELLVVAAQDAGYGCPEIAEALQVKSHGTVVDQVRRGLNRLSDEDAQRMLRALEDHLSVRRMEQR